MRPRWNCIHIGTAYFPIAIPEFYPFKQLIFRIYLLQGQIVYLDSDWLGFPDFEISLGYVNQIWYFFVINLHHAHAYLEYIASGTSVDFVKNVKDGSGDDAHEFFVLDVRPHHRVAFAWASLTICKNCAIKSTENVVDDLFGCYIENFTLFCIQKLDSIKIKCFFLTCN